MAKDAQGHGSETGGGNPNHGKGGRFDSGSSDSSKSSGSGRSKKLNPHDQKIANNLARSVGKAAVNNARASRRAQQLREERATQGGHGSEPRSASAAKMPGFSRSSGGGGSHGSGAGSNPSRMGATANADGHATGNSRTGTSTTRADTPVHVRLSPAAREQIQKLQAMDQSQHKTNTPGAFKMAKTIAASHGAHSTGVNAISRSMKQFSQASAHPGKSAGTGELPRNSSEKFSGKGPPKNKRGTLASGTGDKL